MSNIETYKETVHLLLSVSRLHRSLSEHRLADLGIYNGQILLLRRIAQCKEGVRQKDLANFFGVSPAAIANSLHRMEKVGLVQRTTAQIDSRCNDLRITEKGWEALNASEEAAKDFDETMMKCLSEEELKTFNESLGKIYAALENYR